MDNDRKDELNREEIANRIVNLEEKLKEKDRQINELSSDIEQKGAIILYLFTEIKNLPGWESLDNIKKVPFVVKKIYEEYKDITEKYEELKKLHTDSMNEILANEFNGLEKKYFLIRDGTNYYYNANPLEGIKKFFGKKVELVDVKKNVLITTRDRGGFTAEARYRFLIKAEKKETEEEDKTKEEDKTIDVYIFSKREKVSPKHGSQENP